MGNMPIANQKLMDMLQEAIKNNVIVVIKSQCYHGGVADVYAAGRFLTNLGCILAQDMTTECLFAKLSYLLGKVSDPSTTDLHLTCVYRAIKLTG